VDAWYRMNPSLGLLISEDWIRTTEFLTMNAEDFAAERLGVPKGNAGAAAGPIDLDRWASLTDGMSLPEPDTVRLCLDAPPDRSSASFAIAGRRVDGLLHVSTRHTSKRGEVVADALAMVDGHDTPLIIPPNSPARAWRTELLAAGVELDEMKPAEYSEACGAMLVHVDDGAMRHRGQPDMNQAVVGLVAKSNGDVDIWSRRSSKVNIAPFVAATCALVRVPEKAERALTPMFAAT